MARGNERRATFRDDQDRHRFLETLAEMVEQFGVRVHAYCLMPNHYHLIVETPQANLSQAVGWLQVTYTVRFNRRHRRSGHLFQGRFKAQVVEADAYAQWLVEYLHLNPVRPRRKGERIPAERAAELDRYEWSSHRDYAGLRRKGPVWLSLDWQRYWGRMPGEAQRQYRQRIRGAFEAGTVASPWDELKHGLVLGGESLWERVCAAVAGKAGQQEAVWSHQVDVPARREQVRVLAEKETDEWVKIWLRVRWDGERKTTVAREFGYAGGSAVVYAMRQLERRAQQDASVQEKLQRLAKYFERLKS
jgi:REP element-mobilizing transposase RayT